MERGRAVTILWEILSFIAFVLNLTANCSDRWWVNAKAGGEKTFLRAGLWQVCFDMYRHRFDYYGKIYNGCWWLFSPEIRLLRPWILNNWLRWVQTLSTLSLIVSLFAVIAAILVLIDAKGFKSPNKVLTAASLHGLAGVLMFATVILFGVKGKRRDWMMNWQFNWFGWSFQLAIIACIIHLAVAFIAGYQGLNRLLAENFDYTKVRQEIDDRSTLKVSPIPRHRSRASSERSNDTRRHEFV